MQFILAIATFATAATAQVNTMQEISENWDNIISVINQDLATLKAANPSIYAQATSALGGTEITQDFDVDFVQQVATGIEPAIMNAMFSRAGIEDVTLDGNAIPTDENADSGASGSESPVTSADESASEESVNASTDNSKKSTSGNTAFGGAGGAGGFYGESSKLAEDDKEMDADTSGAAAAAVVATLLAAGFAVITTALF
ncbi:hypothetical protein H4R20_001115 [Coemansia guatemalensis]|uniref:Uncharacterized protein n=1 Tax=Coemansia guatemalensis TaxID=2761395 RepID=A0A9W8I063_9FUNG|nr:hypothetical protein H4R20_001115 [Coemansia guatemalensis]